MKSKKESQKTFAELLLSLAYHHDLSALFDDFLTIVLSSPARDYRTGVSFDETLYEQTKGKYDRMSDLDFPHLFAVLIMEMETRVDAGNGNDVLGEFYETNLSRKGHSQFFTPYPICEFISKSTIPNKTTEPQRIIDPACGSGRMLLLASRAAGSKNYYYGVDIDHTCAKMAAINLFLNGIFYGEIMCANALNPSQFTCSYKFSLVPFGIYRIVKMEESELWNMMMKSQSDKEPIPGIIVQMELF